MKNRYVFRTISALVAALMLTSCASDSVTDTTYQETQAQTEAETEIAEESTVNVILEKYSVNESTFSCGISFEDDFDGNVTLKLSSGDDTVKKEEKVTLAKETVLELSVDGAEFLSGDYEFYIKASSGEANDSAKVKFVGGLPQLSDKCVKWVISKLTLEEKTKLMVAWSASIAGLAGSSYEVKRLGIPKTEFADASSGLRLINQPSMAYPSLTSLASTWDNELVYDITKYIASDFSSYGIDILLGPGLNVQKNIFGGRNFEYFSEDPYLSGVMAASYTNGLQANDIGACLKHYAANSQETCRGSTSSEVTERALREIYLRSFEYALKYSDPFAVMTSYNKINGRFGCAQRELLSILRDEFGFGGYVMSDWTASGDRVQSVNSGNDMYCGSADPEAESKVILNAVNNGRIKMEQIDFCCENILSVVAECEVMTRKRVLKTINDVEEKQDVIRKAGADSMVLLKNDGDTLPFNDKKVALFGNASYITEHCGYGACYVFASELVSVCDGLEQAEGITVYQQAKEMYNGVKQHEAVVNAQVINPANDPLEVKVSSEAAKEAALENDIGIFTISRITREGCDHMDSIGDYYLNLTEREAIEDLSREFHAQGKKFIVLINTGNPIEVASWQDLADAIVYIGLSGEQIGNSVADLLTGKTNFSGKLTSTWPVDYMSTPASEYFPGNSETSIFYEDIYVGYRYYTTFDVDVSYEFGYGLSYTEFEYSDLAVTQKGNDYVLSVKVKNTGDCAGREAVQFYVSKPDGRNEQPSIELAGYAKTALLQPNEEQTVTVTLTYDELKTYYSGDESAWVVQEGEYTFSAGASVEDIRLTSSITVNERITVLDVEDTSGPRVDFTPLSKKNPKPAPSGEVDIAKGKPVTASGSEKGYDALYAVDGSRLSRWSALGTTGSQYWISVDLLEVTHISKITLRWESNTEKRYSVYLSNDGQNWEKLDDYKPSDSDVIDTDVNARYVKIQAPSKGFFSLFEFCIYA